MMSFCGIGDRDQLGSVLLFTGFCGGVNNFHACSSQRLHGADRVTNTFHSGYEF
jgi:hypothetical protein